MLRKLCIFKIVVTSVLTIATTNVALAITPVLPSTVQPAQVSRALYNQQPNNNAPSPAAYQPPAPEGINKKVLEAAKKMTFKFNGVVLEGNHIYSTKELAVFYKKDLHKRISIARLFEIVQAITNYYRNNGYIISRAILPQQEVRNGIIHIKIVEGRIEKVIVAGHPRKAACMVFRYGNKIKECAPLNITRLEKYLLLANELPGTRVTATMAPSKTVGAADMTLTTENNLLQAYFSYDNYGTLYIGPQQLTANIAANSFILSGDSGQITVVRTPKGNELHYSDVNYSMPLNDEGVRLLVGGLRTTTFPLFVLQPVHNESIYTNLYTTVSFPIIRTQDQNLTTRVGFNYNDVYATVLDFPLYTDHLRPLDFGATYNFNDRFYGVNKLSADFRQGLTLFGYTSDTNLETARTSHPGGRGAFSKIAFEANRLQAIKGPFSFYANVQGQWAFNPLLTSEQFSFGGSQFGRGYDPGELLGDKGIGGSLELRLDYSPAKIIQHLQPYIFYDIGEIWNIQFIPSLPRKLSGSATGIGLRFNLLKYISGNVMWTQTLTKQVAAEELIGDGRRPRVFFSVIANSA